MMAEDVSKKMLVLLVIVAMAVSIVGTWVVLSHSPIATGFGQKTLNVGSGQVQVEISGPAKEVQPIGLGQVSLTVVKK